MQSGFSYHARWRATMLAQAIKAGGVVACPAEGVWGLSCDPFNEQAVLKLLELKRRSVSKGLILVASNSGMFENTLSQLDRRLREQVIESWPGPNTWLVPNQNLFPKWITGDSEEVAIRVTSAPALSALSDAFGEPLVSTSANPAGMPPAHYVWEVRRYFGMVIPIMAGRLNRAGKSSTIRRVGTGELVRS